MWCFVCLNLPRTCIVGTCSLFQIQAISLDRYVNDVNLLEKEVLRLNSNVASKNACDIYLEEDLLNLSLFKHWTLFKSLMYSINTAAKFQTLSERGKRRIELFLAKIGYVINLNDAIGSPFRRQTSPISFWSPNHGKGSFRKSKEASSRMVC